VAIPEAYTAVLPASTEDVVAVLLDFDAYPQWQSGVLDCTVVERDDAGRGTLVDMVVDAKVRTIRYRVRYSYDLDAAKMAFDYVSGDLRQCSGRYRFTSRDGGTEVAFAVDVEPAFFLPGPVKRMLRDQAMRNALRDLTRRVSSR
jgi:ribosome-associated toxin RatA of RatAB toxin-antitoxin module